jgi:Ca2+-binding EF-hand superfamily protein
VNKTIIIVTIVAAATAASVTRTEAQEGRPGGGPGREGAFLRSNPLILTLDANGDGVLDEQEIANASAALKKLDQNGDGKLTETEFYSAPRGDRAPAAADSADMIKRLMEFDKNGDGKLAKDELPERMQGMFERGDTDKDGFLTKEELGKMVETQKRSNPAPGRGEREGREGRRKRE